MHRVESPWVEEMLQLAWVEQYERCWVAVWKSLRGAIATGTLLECLEVKTGPNACKRGAD